ncbi:GntR family transcriptional regulator [Roseovarius spongiae]|uniref:GntR family transcriptional regulator n=1 Tax=Roseovarius spongiae TaxID=2320272 RepID=A0A3A8B234_9RHOB|nr:GntR family transcriptional regulator [Roseovarius spongiae]RKF12996.1 GntR family transcriptional regulator [Roseovarius spongiae]
MYDILRAQILNLDREPGTDLDEAALVKEIGISRTPVREAIIRLASEELVTILPNRGAMVAPINLTDFPRYLEAFDLLQRAVTRLAAIRRSDADMGAIEQAMQDFDTQARAGDPVATTIANRDFHNTIGAASGNRFLCDQYARMLNLGMRYSRFPFGIGTDDRDEEGLEQHLQNVMNDHHRIAQAIRARDAELAERLGHEHTILFRERIMKYLNDSKTTKIACAQSDVFSA